MKTIKFLIIFCFCLTISCIKQKLHSKDENHIIKNEIYKTDLPLEKIRTQKAVIENSSQTIEIKGIVTLPPANIAIVSTPAPGFITQLYYSIGQSVKKGSLLAKISNQEYITMQKEYMETKYQLEYYENDYKRQGELTIENASSIKNMERSKADYWALDTKFKALEAQLKYIGINPKYIEEYGFINTLNIYAPISGEISIAKGKIGSYIDSYFTLCEIINTECYYLSFHIPGSYSAKIKTGDTLYLNKGFALIDHISPVIDTETGTIEIHAKIYAPDNSIKPGLYMNANINIDSIPVLLIDRSALIKENGKDFLFIEKEESFKKIAVEKTNFLQNKVKIIDPNEEIINGKIVIEGITYF